MESTVNDVINQMEAVIPTIIASTMLLTSTIKGIFKIEKDIVNDIVSWVIAIGTAMLWVAGGQLTFNLGGWDYLIAGICGMITGLATNKIYTWEVIKNLLDAITAFFGYNKKAIKAAKEDALRTELEEQIRKEFAEKEAVKQIKKTVKKK